MVKPDPTYDPCAGEANIPKSRFARLDSETLPAYAVRMSNDWRFITAWVAVGTLVVVLGLVYAYRTI
jgi:hypothetical protein